MALFRFSVLAERLHLPPGSPERAAALRAQARRDSASPGRTRRRVAEPTLRDWLRLSHEGGFDALPPQPRSDRGRPRRTPPAVAALLTELKERPPEGSGRTLLRQAQASGQLPAGTRLAAATVYRLLQHADLADRSAESAAAKDRRRFAFRQAGALGMSDVLHGPAAGCDPTDRRRRRQTYLLALLDDATRVGPHAACACAATAATFLPVLQQAVLRRGLPGRLSGDHGANYRSRQLAVVCASLGVPLIHARPSQPAGQGQIERFFRTVRAPFLAHLEEADTRSLATLNAKLGAWLEGEYPQSPHRGLDGRTPLDQGALAAENLRRADPELDLDRLFRFRSERRVNQDRTVSLHTVLDEVDAALVGEKVTLLQDPTAPPERPLEVLHGGRAAGQATRLDAYANTRVRRASARRSAAAPPPADPTPAAAAPAPPAAAPLPLRDLAPRRKDCWTCSPAP